MKGRLMTRECGGPGDRGVGGYKKRRDGGNVRGRSALRS